MALALGGHIVEYPLGPYPVIYRKPPKGPTESRQHACFRCESCDRRFVDQLALYQHLASSSKHSLCGNCMIDFASGQGLREHWRQDHCMHLCDGCDTGFGTADEFIAHANACHVCPQCHRHNLNANNLEFHRRTHLPATIPCLSSVCDRVFTTFSGMMLHLDSSACLSGLSPVLLNHSVATSEVWPHFVHATWRPYLVDYVDINADIDYDLPPFKCPGCTQGFGFVSAMFQHWGSSCCDHEEVIGVMMEFVSYLRERHGSWLDVGAETDHKTLNCSGEPPLFMMLAYSHG
ncbi:hypothetical protein BU16DRAFT_528113 [Lophium mytilinum]|uniref:C2H2-type domain-containing protein n=1 Tax=Lophium mytilinum TaxID=390894 RepID=A0A6A6QP62_9PEZI|nr:hypothetical protein BU16DRAFT_528113 [Lophium mytilinum]